MDDQILGVAFFIFLRPKSLVRILSFPSNSLTYSPIVLSYANSEYINRPRSSGLSPKNGPPAALPAARALGTGRCAARYSSSSAKPSPSYRTASVPARSPSRRRSARWNRVVCWRTAYPTESTRSAIAVTPSRA